MVPMDDGAELATWTRWARDGAPHVVLVHGGPGLWDYLGPLGELLAGSASVHRYDQRGCGRSTPSSEQSVQRSVADLEQLRRHWGVERLVLVGHSFGATLALAHAATHPDHVAALVHLSGTGLGDWRTPERAEHARRRRPWAERLAELDDRQRTEAEEVEWRRLTWASDYADPRAGLELARPMAESGLPISWHANRALSVTEEDLLGWAEAVRCPVTVIHGSADPRPMASVVALADRLPRARKRLVEDAGHLPWVEQPEETASLLHEVLESLPR